MSDDLVIRNVEIESRAGLDVGIANGIIRAIGSRLPRGASELDGGGGALIPGIADHHIHLLALAAEADSLVLGAGSGTFAIAIGEALANRPRGTWLRATGYHETMAGELDRTALDKVAPHHPLRVQHQTGSLWLLNSMALTELGAANDPASCIERDAKGVPTGRIWRGDAWLRSRLLPQKPDLAAVGKRLAAWGITAVTDASATTDAASAQILRDAVHAGDLPLRLTLMSAGALDLAGDDRVSLGPVKVLLDDHDLPPIEEFALRIREARGWGRAVAVHCVTESQFAVTLAAFQDAGTTGADRIEHGGVIPHEAIPILRDLRLSVVTQPGFIRERGDRYRAEIEDARWSELYRCATLLDAGVPVAAGSDAPYASADPWVAIRTATDRRTLAGEVLGPDERISAVRGLNLFLGTSSAPGTTLRRVEVGAPADLCLLRSPLHAVLGEPEAHHTRATVVAGEITHAQD